MDLQRIDQLHRDSPLTDIHIHPSLKAYLFGRNLWRHYSSGRSFNPFSSRSDFATLEKGGVGVVWNSLHLPERQLAQCRWVSLAGALLVPAYRKLASGNLMDRLLEQMDAMEREVARRPDRTEVARSASDVRRIRRDGKLAVVHTVEGAHVLDGKLEHLDRLAARGVAMLTLSHFFDNGVAAQVIGIPPKNIARKLCSYDFGWSHREPLTPFGQDVVRRMGALGMIVDITHCVLEARQAVYLEVGRSRPIVASHIGVAAINPDPYNLRDEEIQEIAATGGLIGLIFMTHWLDPAEPRNGLDPLWRTVEHIHNVTGSFDHIALGTDFDGFTDPPDDLRDASAMPRFTQMLLDGGMSESDIRKMLRENAQRVLEAGWLPPSAP